MSKFLRGKKLLTSPPKQNYTKVPNSILFTKGLKASEKLILIQLHYYPSNWTLAYTRLADDLDLRKDTVIRDWKSLIKKGFIIESQAGYTLMDIGTESVPENSERYGKRTYDGTESVLSSGTESVPTEVRKASLKGTDSVPTEEDTKEEDLLNKTEEQVPIEKNVVSFPEPTPLGATVRPETEIIINNKKINTDMITKELVKREAKERGLKFALGIDAYDIIIYINKRENGIHFKKGDLDSMLKYILEYPTKEEFKNSSISTVSLPLNQSSSISDNNTQLIEKSPISDLMSISSIDEFISKISENQLKYYQSLNSAQLYQSLLSFRIDSIELFHKMQSLKMKNIIVQSSPLTPDGEPSQNNCDNPQSSGASPANGRDLSATIESSLMV